MSKGKEAGKIQVYVRVRPFTEREKEKREVNAIEIHQEHSLIRVLDPRSRTNYFFDGVFSPEATNQELYLKVGKPLVYAALNGYKGTLLTYGQTGTGKTFTLLSEDGITTRLVQHCFEKIGSDEIHTYKVMCSFLQVYQEKVYDLLNPRFIVDLPVREHPKKGVYVANLTQHEVKSARDVFALLEIGKQHLVIAETKMVRHSSRSHSIMQLIVERRLKAHIANEKPASHSETAASHEAVQESIMAVDETINNLIKELKQERKSHHKHERECLKELMEKELNNGNNLEGDLIVKGKINLCDLAGSERLTKTKAEGVRLTEAKYLNTSLLELGNVIYALARGHKRHVPYRNSTLTRLLQDCLGDNGKTNFIICIAPSLGEVNETKCSLNFGLRAMRITNVARLNVEVDYKVLAERLAKKLEDHDIKYKFEKLEYLREIQRLKSAISCYQESENFAGKDHEKLVSVIANLSKSVQREKEEKNSLQSELVGLKKQVSQPMGSSTPEVEAVLLAELMSMELLANLQTPDVTRNILSDSSLPAKIKSHLALADTQEALLNNAGCFLQLLDLHLDSGQKSNGRKLAESDAKDYVQFNFSRAGSVELFSKDCSIKISPRGAPQEPCLSLPMYNPTTDESPTGLAGGVRRMLGKLIGRDTKERTTVSPDAHSIPRANAQGSAPGRDVKPDSHDQEEAMVKTKALLKQLANSKEKVEQQVLTLMSSLFEEQIDRSDGQSPQWNELGKKLTRLIMFRRNNMPGLSDADLWANSEDLNSILENCFRFVIIDKALLACLLVIELLDLRQACTKLGERRQFPNFLKAAAGTVQEDLTSPGKSQDEKSSIKGKYNPNGTNGKKTVAIKSQENGMNSPKGSASPRREKLKNLKHTKTELEKEINDMHEDTTKLETELFSTMEEKTKVEEELFGMKHHVTKLRSELFHLKLEKSNLENDVKKSKSQENLLQSADSDEAKLNFESPKEALKGYPELSDVMEASHESNDSENSSQMSDGNENREAFLKTCMENMSKIYTFMPNPEEIASEDELSDDQEPTLSDANIDDSDEEIIITKLARSLRSPCTSPAKEKSFEVSSPNKSGKKKEVVGSLKVQVGSDIGDDLVSKSKEALVKQIQELKRRLHKVEQELVVAQETSDDLEEELDHKKGQLAEAQETITNLENQLVEEKETCEQVRQQYFNIKNQNDILDEKIKALRSELERVLVRENNSFRGGSTRKENPPPSPTKTSVKSPLKSPGKTRVSKIDLRNPPPKQLTSNEMEVVGLIEDNAELKVKLEKATQEKARLEKSQKLMEDKSTKMKSALQVSEDTCKRLKNDLALLTKEKVKLTEEVADLRNNNSNITEELQRYREKSTRLEKDIEAIAYMSTRLEKDNKMLEMEISKMESELSSWKHKHEESSQEFTSLKQERVQVEKECKKVLQEVESLRKEKNQLIEQRFSNDKENRRKDEELKSKDERFFDLESEITEHKRLNSNLQKELAGMAEYQEALEKEYSKAMSEEDRLKQELAKVRSRVIEVETELALVTQNTLEAAADTNHSDANLSLGHFSGNTNKPELNKGGKTFKGTPSKKFYTITHTSEDEIGDTSSSIAESPADESKQVEHENQLLKLENGYLQQQLAESEHILAMYRQDLESAHDLIDKLQAEVKVVKTDAKNIVVEEECKTPSDKDDTIKEIICSENASDEYKLLEEKHAELTREYELLRQQYQDALTDKEKVTQEDTKEANKMDQGLLSEDKTKKEVSNSKQDVSHLQDRIRELEGENSQLKIISEELSQNEKAKRALLKSLEDEKQVKLTLQEKINALQSENEALRMKTEITTAHKGRKYVRRLSLDDPVTSSKDENEASTTQMPQCTNGSHGHPSQLQQTGKECDLVKTTGDNEAKMRKLEGDLFKVTSDKLKLEFELRSAKKDCERLESDLHQSESERNLLNTQLDENIGKAANLEIHLMEMRCSCEAIKDEINTLKNEKRQESFHLHKASVCKEILEKRLEDALRENNLLRQDFDTLHEERRENEKKSAKLEKDKDQLTKEIEAVKTQIRKLEQEFEETQVRTDETREVRDETKSGKSSHPEKLSDYIKLHEEDQEQLTILREELENMTADHNQIRNEFEEIKRVKESLEKQLQNMKNTEMESGEQTVANGDNEIANGEHDNIQNCERTTFNTSEIEKHTKFLEKEKGLLEKELTRVQEECNNLKEKLEVLKNASENTQTQDGSRTDLEGKQEQLERELQDLRELNQKLENECDDSHKLIQQLEIKTKALESLQRELHCFHEENDRLTHEVDIIHHTSKAMTDHQHSRESLEKENSSLKQELESLKESNRKLQMQTDNLNKELVTFKEKKQSGSSTGKINASLQNEVERFQKMQKHLEGELAATQEKTKELENVNESLKKENKAVKGRIKSLEQRNEELRKKEDKKKEKASNVENKVKAKPKHGQSIIKENKETQTVDEKDVDERDNDFQQKVVQLENEEVHLQEELINLREKVNIECVAVQIAPGVTIATQTTELPTEEQKMENASMTTSLNNEDQEINIEQQSEKERAPLAEDIKGGFSVMAKEKLLLEKNASFFVRAQMLLEQSFAKAMRENAALKSKVDEAENALGVLREKLHELEKKSSTVFPVADLKQNALMSNDSEGDAVEDEADKKEGQQGKGKYYPTNAGGLKISVSTTDDGCQLNPTQYKVEHFPKENKHLPKDLKELESQKEQIEGGSMTKNENCATSIVQTSTVNDVDSCLLTSTQSEVDDLRSVKEQLLKEVESLKSQKAELESELKLKKENIGTPIETEKAEQHLTMSNDGGCLLNPILSEGDQLRGEKEQLIDELEAIKSKMDKTESGMEQQRKDLAITNETEKGIQHSTTTDLSYTTQSEVDRLRSEKENLLKGMEDLKSQKEELETDLKWKIGNIGTADESDRLADKNEQENALLKHERQTLLEELEALRNQRTFTESELKHNKESCLKQEKEIKLLLSSYNQEKESLLRELEQTKADCRQAKEKVRELQQIESDFEDIHKNSKEAEKLIIELEKDLLSQTEMKDELRRELQTCKSKLQEIEQLETQLRTCRTENEELLNTNMHLMEEVRKWKDENEFKNTKLQSPKLEKQRKISLNANRSMKRLHDQYVQTEAAIDHYVYHYENNKTSPNVQGSLNGDLRSENNSDAVEHLLHSSEAGIGIHKRSKGEEDKPVEPEETESPQTTHQCVEVEMMTTFRKESTFGGVPIPIIIVSEVDDIETITKQERTASLSLCIEDFESGSPNDQSTPDEEQIKLSLDNENINNIQIEPLSGVAKASEQKDKFSLAIDLAQSREGNETEPGKYKEESVTELNQEPRSQKPALETEKNTHDLNRQPLQSLQQICESEIQTHLNDKKEDDIRSTPELEWTISRLKSELLQHSEEIEKSQHEIGLLVDENLSMKMEISSLANECESLRTKAAVLQTQSEAVLKEQILNDEENEELQQNLQDLMQERNSIGEAKKNLESQKARLEIELSDAIEAREAMERELLRIRSEDTDFSKQRLEEQLHDLSDRYAKLETVLSCVLDENSNMTAELSALQAENSMLKSFKIMEIADNCTQISPRNTEDESDGEGKQPRKRGKSRGNSVSRVHLSLGDDLPNKPLPSSPASSTPQRKCDSSVTPTQAQHSEGATTDELPVTPIISTPGSTDMTFQPVEDRLDKEKRIERGHVLVTDTSDQGAAKPRQKASRVGTPPSSTMPMTNKVQRAQKSNTSKNRYSLYQDVLRRDSDDNDSSMEVHTDSSLVSVTDLDISISSDQISSEDSSIVGPEIRVLQRMHKELAETKCSNVLVKNELSIIRKHNSDLQNQVQKLLSRNNHLKTKMCDRTLSVKRMEKEVSSMTEENNRLQQQALVLQEEMARIEKEKAKFERNISSTKAENKRLKSDLSNIKAESYRTMKELVNLQSENRRLQLEIERLRDDAHSLKGGFSDESVSQELSPWGSMSHGDFRTTSRRSLQERPTKPDPTYLQQRAASDLNFRQHKRQVESPETQDLSPLNLSKGLYEQNAEGGDQGKRSHASDAISVNSPSALRPTDPVSRRGSPLPFTSESSLHSETDENEHNIEKAEEHEHNEEERKGKNKQKIKTILRKFQQSKKGKSSK